MPRYFQLSLLAVASAMPATALADTGDAERHERGFYVAASATYSELLDADATIDSVPAPGQQAQVVNLMDGGAGGSIAVGYDFGRVRLEGEVGITENDASGLRGIVPSTGRLVQDGRQDATRYMLNAYADFGSGRVHPYVGAGLGHVDVDIYTFAPRITFPTEAPRLLVDDSDGNFAYQLMAGLSFDVGRRVALTAQYRWFDVGRIRIQDGRGADITREHRGHNLDVGVRLSF